MLWPDLGLFATIPAMVLHKEWRQYPRLPDPELSLSILGAEVSTDSHEAVLANVNLEKDTIRLLRFELPHGEMMDGRLPIPAGIGYTVTVGPDNVLLLCAGSSWARGW